MKIIGLDIGYYAVKMIAENFQATFPSIVGTAEQSQFRLTGTGNVFTITYEGEIYNVGQAAIEQSRFTSRSEDRDWYNSDEYMVLIHAALSHLSRDEEVMVITGLPVAFYEQDKEALKNRFVGDYYIVRNGESMIVKVKACVVIPQVFGALFNEALNDDGNIVDAGIATGHIGVIDMGGKTTNLLHAHKMGDIDQETDSINIGGWNATRAMKPILDEVSGGVQYDDHEITEVIISESLRYKGNDIDLSEKARKVLAPMATQISNKAKELWPGDGARLDTIFLSGGGSKLLSKYITDNFDHGDIRIVEDGVFANAKGYYKLGKFQAQQGS